MIAVGAVRIAVHTFMPIIISDLTDLVVIPSVSVSSRDQSEAQHSAEAMVALLHDSSLDVEILSVPAPDGTLGRPVVLVHKAGPQGSPHVLLYSRHDVQPAGDSIGWDQADPFTVEWRGEWLFGRGTTDDKAGVIAYAHILRILASLADGELSCSMTVFIEGEEEVDSPSFENFLTAHRDRPAFDVTVVADFSNWKVGTPSLTTSLRGVIQVDVCFGMLDHVLHSGMYGGSALDVATAMCRLIASCHDDAGDVAVAGLVSRSQADADSLDYPEADFRADAGILDGVGLSGTDDLTVRLRTKPSLTLTGMDVAPPELAGNVLTLSYTARLPLRIASEQDLVVAQEALVAHLERHVFSGSRLTVTGREAGPAFDGFEVTPASEVVH